jgi:hypothetical protein
VDGTLFRFVVTRSAQDIPREQFDQTYVRAHRADLRQTPFFAELLRLHAVGDTMGMLRASRAYLDPQSPEYVRALAQLVPIIPQLDDWMRARRDPAGAELLTFLDTQVTGGLGPLVRGAKYARARQRTGDSLLALALATPEDQAAQAILKRAVRLFALVERADADRNSLTLPGSLARAMSAIVVMPNPPYPVPAARNVRATRARVTAARALRATEKAARAGAADRITYIARHEKALDELVAAYEADGLAALSVPSPAGESAETGGQRPNAAAEEPGNGAARPHLRIVPPEAHAPPILLSRQAASRLSQDTRGLLQELSIEANRVSPVDAVNRLEARISELAGELQRGAQGHRFVMVGASLVDTGVNTHNPPASVVDPGSSPCPVPGDVSDVAPETPAAHDEPLSRGPGSPDSFIMRIGDLELVEQTLLGYELGEAAYIENVLTGERKERTHRHLTRSEETTFVETERTATTERDTQTTERFDLQQETQSLIRDDVSRQAGVNVAGSYGTVEVTADARYASNTSVEDSRRTATDHSREVVDRTVSRIVERVLQQRTLRRLDETEETNLHLLDNVTSQANVTGIYRWVNKVYKAQVINYGQRLMFELVVSEPAALYRYAIAQRTTPNVDLVKPNPPGYYQPGSNIFVPLQPQDIDACNYLAWASAYGAVGVQPPPGGVPELV